jgi:MFS family permease
MTAASVSPFRPWHRGLVAFAFCVTMLGTNVPTPLYGLYTDRFGFSPFLVTVVFAVFAAGVIVSLLAFGRLSDEVGRRPVLAAALALSGLAAGAFLLAQGPAMLLVGRLLSGLSAGLFVGAGTATIVDLSPPERHGSATALAIAANMGGLGLGALGSGVVAAALGDPLRLPYWVDLGLVVVALAGLLAVPETVDRPSHARLRVQRPGVPHEVRGLFVRVALAGVSGFAVTGLLAATASLFVARELHHDSLVLFGLPAALTFAAMAVGQIVVRRVPRHRALPGGTAGMLVAVALIAAALATRTLAPLLVGSVVLGLAAGLAIGAGLASITAETPVARRAETSSAFFVTLYTMLALPVVGVGVLTRLSDLRTAALAFSAVMAVLLVGVLVAQLRRGVEVVPVIGGQ